MNQSRTLSRRRLLQMGGIGALSLTTPGIVAARVGSSPTQGSAEKSCIFILLCGGPSHLDTWDLKPEAPAEIRGPYKPIATTVPGMRISELHQNLAKLTQHFALIRSMTHPGNISNHFDAMHHCLSGQASAAADSPYIGSILAKVRPSQRNIASYVWLIKCVGDPVFCAPNIGTGGSLGAPYAPLFVGSADNHPAMPSFKAPDVFAVNETPERMQDRRTICWHRPGARPRRKPARQLAGHSPARLRSGDFDRTVDRHSNSTAKIPVCATATAAIRWDKTCFWPAGWSRRASASSPSTAGPAHLRTRAERTAQFELGHARRRHGHGQRLRQRLLRHGLVLAASRSGTVGVARRSARARLAGEHTGGRGGRVWPHAAHQPEQRLFRAGSTGRRAIPRSWPAPAFAAEWSTANPTRSAPT